MKNQMRQILHSIRLHKVHIYLTTDSLELLRMMSIVYLELEAGVLELPYLLRVIQLIRTCN